jgi:hypothetical protein
MRRGISPVTMARSPAVLVLGSHRRWPP